MGTAAHPAYLLSIYHTHHVLLDLFPAMARQRLHGATRQSKGLLGSTLLLFQSEEGQSLFVGSILIAHLRPHSSNGYMTPFEKRMQA